MCGCNCARQHVCPVFFSKFKENDFRDKTEGNEQAMRGGRFRSVSFLPLQKEPFALWLEPQS